VFTKANGVALLKMFLTTKNPKNEVDLNLLCDPCFNETVQVPGEAVKKDLKEGIKNKKAKLEDKFN
jgi:hypothetical protein